LITIILTNPVDIMQFGRIPLFGSYLVTYGGSDTIHKICCKDTSIFEKISKNLRVAKIAFSKENT